MATLFIAQYETRSFTFTAVSETEQEAREAIKTGWKKHCGQRNPASTSITDFDIVVVPITLNVCLRDFDKI